MSERFEDLPIEVRERVFSFTRDDADGNVEVVDQKGLIDFIADNVATYPALGELVKLNEDALTKHCQETGEVPPGVKLIKTTEVEGQNVTQVRIYHGPTIIPEDERDKIRVSTCVNASEPKRPKRKTADQNDQ